MRAAASQLSPAVRRFVSAYKHANHVQPLATKALTSGSLLAAADLACQAREGPHHLDMQRTLRMGSWGLLVNGTSGHVWYKLLDQVVRIGGARGVASKLVLDQAIYTPPLTVTFFMWQNVLSGHSWQRSYEIAMEELLPTLKVNWVYWSVAHVATFSVVPLQYRVLFVSLKNFLWSIFLSVVANKKK
ncbi:hypothetical protein AB1Y20_005252 [Prymnesium parvum]|uniref:Peroxisomal membrane protein MPV17 n=1 Tax=Prymnesium parvum TaxID=97485 RepID=A0AB34J3L6_PRYPA|mmetsp:Transcript_39402/g.95706  ORF Transcript_39402/g.95706 Transcript_39402/m.95706 type:complete len:187 (+) Transcript_39402:106-666(+)